MLAGPRYRSKDASEARAVRTACGGTDESAPESGSLSIPHPQRARKSQGLRGNTTVYRVGITFPLAFCLTDRSTIRDESPIDWTTVGASKLVLATVRSGRLGLAADPRKGAAQETFDTIDGRLLKFSTKKGAEGDEIDNQNSRAPNKLEERTQNININTTIKHTIYQLALTIANTV